MANSDSSSEESRPRVASSIRPVTASSCFILFLAILFLVIAFASRDWMTTSSDKKLQVAFGVWRTCFERTVVADTQKYVVINNVTEVKNTSEYETVKKCGNTASVDIAADDTWIAGLQTALCLSTILIAVAVVINFLAVSVPGLRAHPCPPFVVACLAYGTATLQVTGMVILMAHKANDDVFRETRLDWAFGLQVVSSILSALSVCLSAVEFRVLIKKQNLTEGKSPY